MSDADHQPAPKVLHIITGSAQMAAEVEAELRDAGIEVERCGDVYHGLARLSPNGTDVAEAIVVGVDRLTPDQLEFFQHASYLLPSVPVFVYGSTRHERKLEQALQLGATARLSEDALQNLVQPPDAAAEVSLPPLRPTPRTQVPAVADELVGGTLEEIPAAPEPAVEEVEDLDELEAWDESEVPDEPSFAEENEELRESERDLLEQPEPELDELDAEDSEEGPDLTDEPIPALKPRVPWIRHADRPVRRPPSAGSAPASPEPEPAEPEGQSTPVSTSPERDMSRKSPEPEEKSDDEKYAPLLSAEEWRALMGDDDDVSAIAPPDPEQEGAGS